GEVGTAVQGSGRRGGGSESLHPARSHRYPEHSAIAAPGVVLQRGSVDWRGTHSSKALPERTHFLSQRMPVRDRPRRYSTGERARGNCLLCDAVHISGDREVTDAQFTL